MKNIQKALCLMLVLCLTLVAGAALAQDYTATEKGFGGDVTVTLTIENNEIVAAKAEGASETEGVGSKAIENLPAAMVEQNSVKVDAVASATITSNAVLAAAEKALAEAGLKPEDLASKEVTKEVQLAEPTFENPDVIVVGAGSSGVNAAIAAANAGAKVYLIEKNDDVGGSIRFAGGNRRVHAGRACADNDDVRVFERRLGKLNFLGHFFAGEVFRLQTGFRQRLLGSRQNRVAGDGRGCDGIHLHAVLLNHRGRQVLNRLGADAFGFTRAFRLRGDNLIVFDGQRYGNVAAEALFRCGVMPAPAQHPPRGSGRARASGTTPSECSSSFFLLINREIVRFPP